MSSSDYENVQVEDVEDDEEDDDSIDEYELGAVAATGEEEEEEQEDEEEKSDQDDDDKQQKQHTRTLMRELLDQYEDLKKNGSQLPSRKAKRLTCRAIGIAFSHNNNNVIYL